MFKREINGVTLYLPTNSITSVENKTKYILVNEFRKIGLN